MRFRIFLGLWLNLGILLPKCGHNTDSETFLLIFMLIRYNYYELFPQPEMSGKGKLVISGGNASWKKKKITREHVQLNSGGRIYKWRKIAGYLVSLWIYLWKRFRGGRKRINFWILLSLRGYRALSNELFFMIFTVTLRWLLSRTNFFPFFH